ncbi:MAG: hypothetical protein ACRDJU_11505, partial [Actinomycetota bacterium]
EVVLRSYAADVGSLPGLADAVVASARRLQAAAVAMASGQANDDLPFQARIIHDDRLLREGPEPLGEFIEGNVTFHLQMHLAQLLALRPAGGSQ